MIDVGVRSDCVVLHVLKRAELVEDVDAELVDEGIIVNVSEQWLRITGDSIGGGIFVVVQQSACVQTLHEIGTQCTISYTIMYTISVFKFKYRYRTRYGFQQLHFL